ncbi:MAG: alpha/beta hydrolase [Planctomycetes bacterium]|nr:alpha/beta hydrolase [Planctomycetota bacterium]
MPIDPQVQALLDEIDALDAPPLHTLGPEKARIAAAADSGAVERRPPLAAREDRTVPGPAGPIPVRIYVPRGEGPWGILVFYHGGGWVLGGIATHDVTCCQLADAAGCMVVSVDYRLAPEHKYPAAVDDAYAAVEWVFEHAESMGGDPRRVAVGGDSAGGNLAAAVCLMARDRNAFQPRFQLLIYPIVDYHLNTPSYLENAEGCFLTRETMKWFWQCYLQRDEDGRHPYASPLRAEDLGGLPEALVITAEYDPLRDEGEAYAARLRQAGVTVTQTRYDGMIHAFFRRTAQFDKARAAMQEVSEALRRALGSHAVTPNPGGDP